jgi:hypothetical protein
LEKYWFSSKKSKNRLPRRWLFELIMLNIHAGILSKVTAGNDPHNLGAT